MAKKKLKGNDAYNLQGQRYLIRVSCNQFSSQAAIINGSKGITMPNLPAPDGYDLYWNMYSQWHDISTTAVKKHASFIGSIAYQPFPRHIARESAARGGDVLELRESDGDLLMLEFDFSWSSRPEDQYAWNTSAIMTDGMEAH